MRRFLRLVLHACLIFVAAIISFMAVDTAMMPGAAGSSASMFNGMVAGGFGIFLGLFIAWTRRVPWRMIPVLWRHGVQRASREFWWTVAGGTSIAVLLFY